MKRKKTSNIWSWTLLLSLVLAVAGCGSGGGGSTPGTDNNTGEGGSYTISGEVADSTGIGMSGATVTLSGSVSNTTTTDASGNYSFTGLANGSYTVTPSKTGVTFNPTSSAQTINGVNVSAVVFLATVSAAPTYNISGTVTVSGTALQGVTMTLNTSTTTTTDTGGNYSCTGLVNGNYTVTPSKPGYTFNPSNSAQAVSGANVTAVNFSALPVASGSPDTSFNNGKGFVVYKSNGNINDYGYAMTIDANGKILVTGKTIDYANYGNYAMVIWRYNTDGTLDTTFNSTGYKILTSGNSTDLMGYYSALNNIGNSIAVDSNGKIIVAGLTASDKMGLWKFNTDGTLDTSFNGTGYMGTGYKAIAYAVTTDASNKIIVVGQKEALNYMDVDRLAVWRFNPNGTLDTSFNSSGYVFYSSASVGKSVKIDASGKILVAGGMTVWRYNTNGQLDTSFNSPTGYAQFSGNVNDGDINSIFLSPGGKILLAGVGDSINTVSPTTASSNMVIWQYNSDGTLDTSYNSVGYVKSSVTVGGPGYSNGQSITMDSNGKILVTGSNDNATNNGDMVIWRYNADGTVDTSFNNPMGFLKQNGTAGGNGRDVGHSILIDGNGKIVVAGYSSNGGNSDMVVWRYNPN